MKKTELQKIIKQVLYKQVGKPPISYKITDNCGKGYTSEYIDKTDFKAYLKRVEKQLLSRLINKLIIK